MSNNTVREELKAHLINTVEEQYLGDSTDFEELHFKAFNEDYYIIGYYQASEWLKQHDIGEFEAMQILVEWEQDIYGKVFLKPEDINSEMVVNLYVCIKGEELLNELPSYLDLSDTSYDDLMDALSDL